MLNDDTQYSYSSKTHDIILVRTLTLDDARLLGLETTIEAALCCETALEHSRPYFTLHKDNAVSGEKDAPITAKIAAAVKSRPFLINLTLEALCEALKTGQPEQEVCEDSS